MFGTNAAGKLTRAEHEAGAEKMLMQMDTGNDGFLSKDEYKGGRKLMKKDKCTCLTCV